jgi:regulation of enolase protein 1 (concanavalin A-like superfamily)
VITLLTSASGCSASQLEQATSSAEGVAAAAPVDEHSSSEEFAQGAKPALASVRPVLSIAANGAGEARIFPGWPLILEGVLLHPAGFRTGNTAEPLLLANENHPWSDDLRLEVRDSQGKSQDWPLQLAAKPADSVTLDRNSDVELAWWLSPEATATFTAGRYEITALLDTSDSTVPDAWKGKTAGVPITIQIDKESALTPQQESEKHLLLISYYQLRKDSKQAAAQIEELLHQQPDNIGALSLKANLLADQGKHTEALEFSNRGIQAFMEKYPDAQEPPIDLVRRHHALLDQWLRQAPIAVAAHEPGAAPAESPPRPVEPPQPASGRIRSDSLPIGAAPRPLEEKDLSLLVELKIDPAAVVSKIQAAGVATEVDEAVIARLKTSGAPETVLQALRHALAAKTKPAAAPALTYEDVLRLLSLGVDEQAILRRHAKSPAALSLDAGQTAILKQAGASDNLLAVLSAGAPGGKVAGEPAATENAAGAGRMIPGWGEFIDPVGDCRGSEQDDKVTITVPGAYHDLWPVKGKVNAPLVLEDAEGDFTVEVKVVSVTRAEPGSAIGGASATAFHAGTLVIWQDDKNFVRLDRTDMHKAGRAITGCYLHVFRDGERVVELAPIVPDRPTHLRLARKGDQLKAAYSQDDGRTWQEFPQQPLDLPLKVKVGVSALNGTNRENVVQFEGLKITK